MSTRIKTNKITYKIDRESLRTKYDFFALETSEKYIKSGAYVLDAPSMDFDIKSILFESGRRALIMMQKDDRNRFSLKTLIENIEGGSKLFITEVHIEDTPDNVIIQLLLNALSSYDSKFLKFNNLTGHLYCFHPDWLKHKKEKSEDIIWKIPCLELKITRDFHLDIYVRTFTSERLKNRISFTRKRFEEYPKYILSKDNTLRRKLIDDTEIGFIMRQTDGAKTEIPFLDLQDEQKFDRSKVGILTRVADAFNAKYGSMAVINWDYVDVSARIDYSSKAAKENYIRVREKLGNYGVHIVDQIRDAYSDQFIKDLCFMLQNKYSIKASVGKRVKKDGLNICVIHNEEYYDGEKDPHDIKYSSVAVQHVTMEDFVDNAEYAISTVIHEVLIKRDLEEGRISLFDWKNLGLTEDISFGMAFEVDDDTKYFFMVIHPDGSFEIKEQEFTLFEMNEYTDCVNILEDAKTKGENVCGIIRDAQGRINTIKDTGIFTLPEAEEIKALLNAGDNKLRGKNRREKLLSSCLDIKLYEEDGKQFYFVGTIGEGMKWSIPRAANVRSIEGYNKAPLMFKDLLPTMSVSFVRNGQLTVVPFPFKYLREYVSNIID